MNRKISGILVILTIITLTLAGCTSKTDGYVAKVNGQEISKQDYEQRVSNVQEYLSQQGVDYSTDDGKATLVQLKSDVLESMISTKLIEFENTSNSWDINTSEVEKQVDLVKEQLGDKDYDEWLKEQAMTDNDIHNYLAFSYYVSKDTSVTEEEISQYFESNYSQYGGESEQVKARHILVKTEEEALAIIKQLKEGADFAELAKEKSIESAAATSGGDLGYFKRGAMVPEFEDAAFSQEVGVVSAEPVKTDFGYHVILVEDHKKAVAPDFASVKDKVAEDALVNAKNQKAQSYYSNMREKAEIEYAKGYQPNK